MANAYDELFDLCRDRKWDIQLGRRDERFVLTVVTKNGKQRTTNLHQGAGETLVGLATRMRRKLRETHSG